jgi:D-alanine-D-alanine ligase
MSGHPKRVAILYNAPSTQADDPRFASEADVVEVAREIANKLASANFDVAMLPAAPPVGALVSALENEPPDVVFNLIEGYAGRSAGEAWITGLLDLLAMPYTGCPPEAQSLCHSKSRTKALLTGSGLPTAPMLLHSTCDFPSPPFEGPYFVKPDAEDASLGIDQASVVGDRAGLGARVAHLQKTFGLDVLIESYLPGGEFNVGVLALPEPLPLAVAEVLHSPGPGHWPILTYDAKWAIGSVEDLASPIRCPAEVDQDLAARLGRLAISAFRATGCRDYARVDFRLNAEGEPMILEVNPNPDLGPTAGWARALRASGRDYSETLVALVEQAIARGPRHA